MAYRDITGLVSGKSAHSERISPWLPAAGDHHPPACADECNFPCKHVGKGSPFYSHPHSEAMETAAEKNKFFGNLEATMHSKSNHTFSLKDPQETVSWMGKCAITSSSNQNESTSAPSAFWGTCHIFEFNIYVSFVLLGA